MIRAHMLLCLRSPQGLKEIQKYLKMMDIIEQGSTAISIDKHPSSSSDEGNVNNFFHKVNIVGCLQ